MSRFKIHLFLFLKLPSAFWCGVRLKSINPQQCTTTVRHWWFNQNPFGSMYFAVQAMAAELSAGALVMQSIRESGQQISMLVANNKSTFSKKATGKITFTCNDGEKLKEIIHHTIASGEGQTIWMKAVGANQKGEVVCEMDFEWTLKLKS